jgi:PAS domain S-box-containing protein
VSVENCRYGKAKGKRQEARVKRVWAILHFFTQFSFIVFTYLQQSEAQLDGFFYSASMGMSIFDKQLKFVKINDVLAKINGIPVGNHLGKNLQEIVPDLFPKIEHFYQKFLSTGKPLLNQEIIGQFRGETGIEKTWLASYFPIFDIDNVPYRVGVVMIDISDRKAIELQLQKQARINGLTQIANRRYFNEVFLHEWQHCLRTQEPLSDSILLLTFDF